MSIQSVNPYNGQVLDTFKEFSDQQVTEAIEQSHKSFLKWRETSFAERAELMRKCSDTLLKNKDRYGRIISLEMGKILKEATSEVEKCAKACQFYAEKAESFLADEPLHVDKGEAYIHYNPLGPILAVMPWNFPFWQVFRFAAPGLMAGNTGLLKHASNVPQCAQAIEQCFAESGFPRGVFQSLLISNKQVSAILENPLVRAATLTGSEGAGSKVAEVAGKHLKKTVLELGGSDPFIVLQDANLEEAVKTAVKARMINYGQSCIAAKRFIVHQSIADKFVQGFANALDEMKYGDPLDENSDYGPMARKDLAEDLYEQVKKSIEKGAKLLYGTLPADIEDANFPPMILGNVQPGMPAYHEELFGPVASIFEFEDVDQAIHIANDTDFGLGASLWTQDDKQAHALADRIESGAVYINQLVFSDPSVPFGGVKRSGYGRELSHLGIREFTNQKTVWKA
jgi:succinate-semialdehyde dehydrogenase/glutarate-semialdehyde dehydrogenase